MNKDLGPTHDIQGVEIFAAGTWNGDKYSVEDLDEMVRGFNDTNEKIKPYLKLGHDDKQKMLQKDGYPAAGYISKLYRVGEKLVADFVKVPKVIHELLRVGGYRRVSSEIFVGMPVAGKVYRYLLKAVALLGGDTPAVQNLKDVLALYASPEAAINYEAEVPLKIYEMEPPQTLKEVIDMTEEIKKLQEEIVALNRKLAESVSSMKEFEAKAAQVEPLKTELDKTAKALTEAQASNKELNAKVEQYADEKTTVEVNSAVEKLISEKKIVPAQKEAAFALLKKAKGAERKYSLGGKDITEEELVLSFFQNSNGGLSTDEKSHQTSPNGEPGKEAADKLQNDLKVWMEKNPGKTYRDALEAVSPNGVPYTDSVVKE